MAAVLSVFADHLGHNLSPSLEPPECREEASHRGGAHLHGWVGVAAGISLMTALQGGGESLAFYNIYAVLATVISNPKVPAPLSSPPRE